MVASNLFLCGQWCNDELSSISCCHCGGKHRLFRSGSVRSKGKCTLNFGNIVNWFLLCLCHFNKKKIISGCAGFLLLCAGFFRLWCASFSLWWLLVLRSMGSREFGLQRLQLTDSGAWGQSMWPMGLVAPRHVESFWTRDWTCVTYRGRRILTTEPPEKPHDCVTFHSYWQWLGLPDSPQPCWQKLLISFGGFS